MKSNLLRNQTAKYEGGQAGQASIELVMSLLMFVMMLGTLLSLSMYMYMHHNFLTAAKEGARAAAAESKLGSQATYDEGVQNVKDRVSEFVGSTTGIDLDPVTDIIVDGPNPTGNGDQTVTVTVTHDFENPIQIRTFMNRLSGGSAEGLDTFTISDNATMRYEE